MMDYKNKYKIFLAAGDAFFLYLSLFLSLVSRQGFYFGGLEYKRLFPHFSLLFLFWIFFLFILDFYSLKLRISEFNFFRYLLIFSFLALFSGVLYFYLQPQLSLTPRIILFLTVFLFALFFYGWRFLLEWLFSEKISKEKILFLGSASELEELKYWLEKPFSPYKVAGVYSGEGDQNKLKEILDQEQVEKIIFSNCVERFKEILSFFPDLKFKSFANFYEENMGKVALSCLRDSDYLNGFYREEEKINSILKRFLDVLFSLVGVAFLFAIFPLLAILIKIDSRGPIFFFQERIGKGRKIFHSYKFRSMFPSKKEKAELWREKNKGEITKAGIFLRFTHLDELPQFFNILKGDLSFVGPRPEWTKIGERFEKEIPFYFLRYKVKPGLTGWAQINFPPSTSVEEAKEKFKYDLYYIKHRSFLFDLIIFFKSLRKIFG